MWALVFSAAFTGFLSITYFYARIERLFSKISADELFRGDLARLTILREDLNRFVKIALEIFLALTTTVGVSMSILLHGGKETWHDKENLINGTSMLIGFTSISIAVLIWVVFPYMRMQESIYRKLERHSLESDGDTRAKLDE